MLAVLSSRIEVRERKASDVVYTGVEHGKGKGIGELSSGGVLTGNFVQKDSNLVGCTRTQLKHMRVIGNRVVCDVNLIGIKNIADVDLLEEDPFSHKIYPPFQHSSALAAFIVLRQELATLTFKTGVFGGFVCVSNASSDLFTRWYAACLNTKKIA